MIYLKESCDACKKIFQLKINRVQDTGSAFSNK